MLEPIPGQQPDPEKLVTDESMRLIADRLRDELRAQVGADDVYDFVRLRQNADSVRQRLVQDRLLDKLPLIQGANKLDPNRIGSMENNRSLIAVVGNHGFRVGAQTQHDGSIRPVIFYYDRTDVMKRSS